MANHFKYCFLLIFSSLYMCCVFVSDRYSIGAVFLFCFFNAGPQKQTNKQQQQQKDMMMEVIMGIIRYRNLWVCLLNLSLKYLENVAFSSLACLCCFDYGPHPPNSGEQLGCALCFFPIISKLLGFECERSLP